MVLIYSWSSKTWFCEIHRCSVKCCAQFCVYFPIFANIKPSLGDINYVFSISFFFADDYDTEMLCSTNNYCQVCWNISHENFMHSKTVNNTKINNNVKVPTLYIFMSVHMFVWLHLLFIVLKCPMARCSLLVSAKSFIFYMWFTMKRLLYVIRYIKSSIFELFVLIKDVVSAQNTVHLSNYEPMCTNDAQSVLRLCK